MNIVINDYCNLQCKYCFANETMTRNKQKQNMTQENFNTVIKFLKQTGNTQVRLIGGEPTLHPDFITMLGQVANDDFFKRILIFSNGTFSRSVAEMISLSGKIKDTSVLINCNHPDEISEVQYKTMCDNIALLASRNPKIVQLGVNIFDRNINYDYVLNLAKQHNISRVRWSLAIPNVIIDNDFDAAEYFRGFVPGLIEFLNRGNDMGIKFNADCNSVPPCVLNDEQMRALLYVAPDAMTETRCNPIIDVLPDLSVIRCFGCSQEHQVKLSDFSNISKIVEHFNCKFSSVAKAYLFPECARCPTYKRNGKSCACLNYRKHRVGTSQSNC